MCNRAPIHNGLQFGHLLSVFPEEWELRFKPLQAKGAAFKKKLRRYNYSDFKEKGEQCCHSMFFSVLGEKMGA